MAQAPELFQVIGPCCDKVILMCIYVMGETDQTADSNDIFLITIFFLYVLNVWMCWKSCITSSTTSVCNDTYNETKYLQSFHQHFHNWLVGNSQRTELN